MKQRITAGLTAVTMAVALIAGPVMTVSADRYYRYSERQIRDFGWRNGFDLGTREGQRDYRLRLGFEYKQNRAYRNGMIGYRDEYYHDGNYRQGFRQGFEEGYREAYYGRGNAYDNRPGWGNDYGNQGRRDDCDSRPDRRSRWWK